MTPEQVNRVANVLQENPPHQSRFKKGESYLFAYAQWLMACDIMRGVAAEPDMRAYTPMPSIPSGTNTLGTISPQAAAPEAP